MTWHPESLVVSSLFATTGNLCIFGGIIDHINLYVIVVKLVDYAFAPPKATVANFGLRSHIKFGVKVRET